MSSLLASDRAFVPCRIERRSVRCGAKCGLGTGGHRPAAAHKRHAREEGPALKAGGGYRECAERTENMPRMSVTLDVSKLSGWLNASPPCRVERRGVRCGARCGPGAGGHGPAPAHERHARREGPAVKAGKAIGHARRARGTCSAWP
eukprot:scaffold2361_cov91-Phaeocystis_antarctica.AAC.1